MKQIIEIIIIFLTFGQISFAQQKQGHGTCPDAFYRGTLERTIIDHAGTRILYALNAEDINKMDTYIDLGQLQIGKTYIKYCSLFAEEADNTFEKWWKANPHSPVYQNFLGLRGRERTNWSEYQWSSIFFKGDTLTEWATMPFRIFKHYRYSEPIPRMSWKISQETQTICGYKCQKATCHWRGRDFVAWFTTAIPIRRGPWKFGGLPGLILKVYDTNHFYTFEAIGIEKGHYPVYRYPKKQYPVSTRQKVWKLQGDLNRNLEKTIGLINPETGEIRSVPIPYEQLEKE
jgi:GLPGLI family protein